MKKRIELRKKERSSKGITLIALVITIIVLLILAAVSIATLTGDNGILTKAQTAKEEKTEAEAKEKVQIAVMGSFDKNGKLNLDELKENLRKVEGFESGANENNFPITVMVDGQQIIVQENGTVVEKQGDNPTTFNPETLTIGEATNTDKYGQKVTNYTVTTDEFTSGIWRLFYQDTNYTYLITDECVGDNYLPGDKDHEYLNGTFVSKIGQKLNPMISFLFTETNSTPSIAATAWFTDPNVWSHYTNEDAVFAIASPTLELFVASYNNTGKSNRLTLEIGSEGYNIPNVSSGFFKTEENYGIYASVGKSYWLASPNYTSGGISINGNTGRFNSPPDQSYVFQHQYLKVNIS